jgi:hypothetical protein
MALVLVVAAPVLILVAFTRADPHSDSPLACGPACTFRWPRLW